ncbi:hypothetical protein ACOME3_004990 [Neoechinorhynchus agilis]
MSRDLSTVQRTHCYEGNVYSMTCIPIIHQASIQKMQDRFTRPTFFAHPHPPKKDQFSLIDHQIHKPIPVRGVPIKLITPVRIYHVKLRQKADDHVKCRASSTSKLTANISKYESLAAIQFNSEVIENIRRPTSANLLRIFAESFHNQCFKVVEKVKNVVLR